AGGELPDGFAVRRRRLEGERAGRGTREFSKVHRLLEHAAVGLRAAAVEPARVLGATSAAAVRLILAQRRERPVGLFSLDGHLHLKAVQVQPPDLTAYRCLVEGGPACRRSRPRAWCCSNTTARRCSCRPWAVRAQRWRSAGLLPNGAGNI